MTTVQDILDAVNRLLVERWPDRTVYIDVCPVDFAHPSFWLFVEEAAQSDANRFYIRRSLKARLTLYDLLDEHYDASWQRLSKEAEEAMTLLTPPLEVNGRRLKLELKALPRDPDRAYIQLSAEWFDPRPGLGAGEDAPPAEHYHLRAANI